MSLRFLPIEHAPDIAPWAEGLGALERDITYPLDAASERFFIDHGPAYHPFFSAMGDARFLVVADGTDPVGLIAGVWRTARIADGRTLNAIYAGDLKLSPRVRGQNVGSAIASRGLVELARRPHLWGFSFIYGAAMRDVKGDVRRSFRGAHPGRLAAELGRLSVYFVSPRALAALPPEGPGSPVAPGLELSPRGQPTLVSTAGRKDLRLVSTGAPWPLVHLPAGPSEWGDHLGAHLRRAGSELAAQDPDAVACFAIDERLTDAHAWLRARGIAHGATTTLLALATPWQLRRLRAGAAWAHLATSEI